MANLGKARISLPRKLIFAKAGDGQAIDIRCRPRRLGKITNGDSATICRESSVKIDQPSNSMKTEINQPSKDRGFTLGAFNLFQPLGRVLLRSTAAGGHNSTHGSYYEEGNWRGDAESR